MSSAPKMVPIDYIEATPGVCGGRARIAGTRMKVSQVASEYEHLGLTPDEIVDAHPHLTLAVVHAALAYYYDHREDIRAEWREADDFIAKMKEEHAALAAGGRPTPRSSTQFVALVSPNTSGSRDTP